MLGQSTKSLIWALSLTNLAHSLPGRQALAARQCSKGAGNLYSSPCNDDTSSITAAPVPRPSFHPKNNVISVTCDGDGMCSAFDVSSSLVTVFNGSDITRTDWPSPSASLSVPILTTGTGVGPEPSSASKGPFANSTDNSLTVGSTGIGTGSVSSTGLSSTEANSTTTVRSTITLSVTTYTDSSHWSAWTNWPGATGTAGSSGIPAPTTTGLFSNATSPIPSYVNSTFVSAGQTFTSLVPVAPQSYVSTATYIFSGTTIEIPIPNLYSNSLPAALSSATTTTSEEQASHTTETSYSSCRTTTDYGYTGTGVTTAAASSTLICWGIECVDHVCYDFLNRYPLTANATSGPFTNGTTSPIATGSGAIYNTDGTVPAQPTDSPSSVWPSSNATRNPDAYTNIISDTITPTVSNPSSIDVQPIRSQTYYSTDSVGNVFTIVSVDTFLPTPHPTPADSTTPYAPQPSPAITTIGTEIGRSIDPALTTTGLTSTEDLATYTFTATDSSGNAFTTSYSGGIPASWIDAPSDSSALVSQLSEATASTSAEGTSSTSESTFAWADWSSTLSTSATPTSGVSVDSTVTNTLRPLPATETDAAASTSAWAYGGESQSRQRRSEVKHMRKEKKSTKEVKDFGLGRKAAEMERMGWNEDVDRDEGKEPCRGIACWLWR